MSDYNFNSSARKPHVTSTDRSATYDTRRTSRPNGIRSNQTHSHGGSLRPQHSSSQASHHQRSRSFSSNSKRRMDMYMVRQRSLYNNLTSQMASKSTSDVVNASPTTRVTFDPVARFKSDSKLSTSKTTGHNKLSFTAMVKNTIMSITRSSPSLIRRNSFSGSLNNGSNKTNKDAATVSANNKTEKSTTQSSKNEKSTKFVPGVVGIANHGNSCFINAVVQCLSNTRPFLEYFLNNRKHLDKPLTRSFANLLEGLWLGKYSPKLSQKFRNNVGVAFEQFSDDSQNDSQEFLLLLLDRIQQEITAEKNLLNKNNPVKSLFEARLTSRLTCLKCYQSSFTIDTLFNICLPIQEVVTMRTIYVPTMLDVRQCLYSFQMDSTQTVQQLLETAGRKLRLHPKNLAFVHVDKSGRFKDIPSLRTTVADVMPFEYLFLVQLVNRKNSDSNFPTSSSSSSPSSFDRNEILSSNIDDASHRDGEFLNIVALPVLKSDTTFQRFGSLISLDVSRTASYYELQMLLLSRMKPYFDTNFFVMKSVRSTFRMRVQTSCYDDGNKLFPDDDDDDDAYLRSRDEMPLFSLLVDRALALYGRGEYGATYLRIVVEFQYNVREHLLSQQNFFARDESYSDSDRDVNICDLNSCLDTFTQQERLGADDTWTCSKCRCRQSGTLKSLMFSSLPEVLVIHLKRFKQDGEERNKLESHIDFPIRGLDLSRLINHTNSSTSLSSFSDRGGNERDKLNRTWDSAIYGLKEKFNKLNANGPDDYVYDLVGVCNHHGDLQSGHYTAFCQNPLNGLWYHFNDDKVEEVPEKRIVTEASYMLFYWRRGHRSHSHIPLNDWLSQSSTNGISSTDSSQSLLSVNSSNGPASCSSSLDNLTSNRRGSRGVSSSLQPISSSVNGQPLKSILKSSQSVPFSAAKNKSPTGHVKICDDVKRDDGSRGTCVAAQLTTASPTTKTNQINGRLPSVESRQHEIKTMELCSQARERMNRKTNELVKQYREEAFQAGLPPKKSASLFFEKVPSTRHENGEPPAIGSRQASRTLPRKGSSSKHESTV